MSPPAGPEDGLSLTESALPVLRDRMAATPETIPVPDWHREILDERLKDLETDPAAGDSWEVVQQPHPKEVRQQSLNGMTRQFIVRPLAETDLEDGARWYEDERAGLAERLLSDVDRTFARIRERPFQFPAVGDPGAPTGRRRQGPHRRAPASAIPPSAFASGTA